MITALVVEDESRIRNGLLTHIPWQEYQVDEVRSAGHAEEAIALCRDYQPDIILSDIRMPGMDGVELCRRLRSCYPNSQIIFVTGYAEKEYLKAAIDLHAISYVEKPIQIPEVLHAISMAVEEIKRTRGYDRTFLTRLLRDGVSSTEVHGAVYSVLLFRIRGVETTAVMEILLQMFAPFRESWQMEAWGEPMDAGRIAVLLARDRAICGDQSLVQQICAALSRLQDQGDYFVGMGRDVYHQDQVPASYRSAQRAEECLGFMGWNHCACEQDLPEQEYEYKLTEEMRREYAGAVSRRESTRLISILEEIHTDLVTNRAVLNGKVRHLYYSLYEAMERAGQVYDPEQLLGRQEQAAGSAIEQAQTLEELHHFMLAQVQEMGAAREDASGGAIVPRIQEYIAQHYGDPELSVRILADLVYLTPNYLNNLFKKATGYTIGQYLVDVRVEAAMRLLKNPEYKLYQVVSMVGYEDADYFTKIFKKRTGMTPSEYRRKG